MPRGLPGHLAHYLAPACVAVLFLLLGRSCSSRLWTHLSSLSFGVYLFHPIVLDLLEIAERDWDLSPGPTVAFNFLVVTALSYLVVMAAARAPVLRSLFGISGSVR